MICEIVTFPAPAGASREEIVADAQRVVPRWQSEAGLVRKHFVWSDDRSTLSGIYLWKSRAAAERAHDAAWRRGVEERSGAAPEIRYFDTFLIVDNDAGTATVYPPEDPSVSEAAE